MPDSVMTTSTRGRPSCVQRQQLGAGQAAVAVEARLGADQRQRLRDRARLRSSGCRCPTAPARRLSGKAWPSAQVALPAGARPGARRPSPQRRWGCGRGRSRAGCGPVGSTAGVRSRSPPGRRAHEAAVQRVQQAGDLVVLRQQRVDARPAPCNSASRSVASAGMQRRRPAPRRGGCRPPAPRPRRAAGRRPCEASAIDSSRSTRSAALGAWPTTCRPCGISVYSSSSTRRRSSRAILGVGGVAPGRLGGGQFQLGGLGLQQQRELARARSAACGSRLRQRSSDGLQVDQARYSPACGHRRRQVADQRGGGAALGDRAFDWGCSTRTGRSWAGRRSAGRASSRPTGRSACRA